jgi:hypothetical protein
LKLSLRYPANATRAAEHAGLAVQLAREEYETRLDYSEASLETLDELVERLREEGMSGEEAAETLFVFGCYLGEVMARQLLGRWVDTPQSPLAEVSPWPMVVVFRGGSAWDTIGKVFRRLELGDSEYLPAFFAAAKATLEGRL